jgi:hypothetical protein
VVITFLRASDGSYADSLSVLYQAGGPTSWVAAVDPGAYVVQFTGYDGVQRQFYPGVTDRAKATTVTPSLAAPVTGIDATLSYGSRSVAGKVADSGGRGFGDVIVSLVDPASGNQVASTTTASDGTYRVFATSGTSLIVQFTAPGYGAADQYWKNTTDRSKATALAFTDAQGGTYTGIDAVFERGSSLSGTLTVTGASGSQPFVTVQRVGD